MTAGTLSLTGIVEAQEGMWYFVPQFVGFLIFLIASLRGDQPPAVRPRRGRRRARRRLQHRVRRRRASRSYYFAEYLNVLVVSGVATTVFLGGWLLPFGIDPPAGSTRSSCSAKMSLFVFFFIWIRATLPRLRYDQLMSFGWKVLLPLATLNALVTAIVVVVD